MGQAKQGGSILGYVIVGGVLTLLLLGGAFALRNNWSGQPAEAPTEVADRPTPAPSDTKDEAKNDTNDAPAAQPAPQPTAPTTPQTSTAPNARQLPQSGPADTVLSVAILTIIVASFGVYAESRRLARSL